MSRWLCMVVFVVAGCKARGNYELRLFQADAVETPLSVVDTLRVEYVDSAGEMLAESTIVPAVSGRTELGDFDEGSARVLVTGLRGSDVVARATSRLLKFVSGIAVSERLPFHGDNVAVVVADTAFAPTIDGVIDDWEFSPTIILDSSHVVVGTPDDGDRAEIYLASSPDTFFVGAVVYDDCPVVIPSSQAALPTENTCNGAGAEPDLLAFGIDRDNDGSFDTDRDLWLELKKRPNCTQGCWGWTASFRTIDAQAIDIRQSTVGDGTGWSIEVAIKRDILGLPLQEFQGARKFGVDVLVFDHDATLGERTVYRWTGGNGPVDQLTPSPLLFPAGYGKSQ